MRHAFNINASYIRLMYLYINGILEYRHLTLLEYRHLTLLEYRHLTLLEYRHLTLLEYRKTGIVT